jgi:hypothetical protein
MARFTVYVPDDVFERAQERIGNVSVVCRAAIEAELAQLEGGHANDVANVALQLRLLAERLLAKK